MPSEYDTFGEAHYSDSDSDSDSGSDSDGASSADSSDDDTAPTMSFAEALKAPVVDDDDDDVASAAKVRELKRLVAVDDGDDDDQVASAAKVQELKRLVRDARGRSSAVAQASRRGRAAAQEKETLLSAASLMSGRGVNASAGLDDDDDDDARAMAGLQSTLARMSVKDSVHGEWSRSGVSSQSKLVVGARRHSRQAAPKTIVANPYDEVR